MLLPSDDDIPVCVRKFEAFLIEWWVARLKRSDSGDFQAFWKKSSCVFEPYCLEYSTWNPTLVSLLLDEILKISLFSRSTCRMLLILSALERAMFKEMKRMYPCCYNSTASWLFLGWKSSALHANYHQVVELSIGWGSNFGRKLTIFRKCPLRLCFYKSWTLLLCAFDCGCNK